MAALMITGTVLTLALVATLVFLLADAVHREHLDDVRRMQRRARVLRLPTVLSRTYVGVDRRHGVRDERPLRHAA